MERESHSTLHQISFCTSIHILSAALHLVQDEAYQQAGATLGDGTALGQDIVLKVRAPDAKAEVAALRKGATTISFLWPAQSPGLLESLQTAGTTSFGLDCIPRTISRAQSFDALSSQVLSSHHFASNQIGNWGNFRTVVPALCLFV